MHNFLKNLKFIRIKDIIAFIIFIIAIIPSIFFKKITKNQIWLICEDKNEARDNGYAFFKYMCNNNFKNIKPVYAISKKSPDYEKVRRLGKCINYGTLVHWIYYLAAKYNISSQKGGKPNAAICYFLEVYGIIKNRRIFLQHGITISNAKWLYYKNTKMRLFICGAKPEYEYIKTKFGYPNENLKYLGFPRFDDLHNIETNKRQILIMPTWREWLNRKTDAYYEFKYDGIFEHSDYYKYWNSLLNNSEFEKFIEQEKLQVIFYPHRNMQQYLENFSTNSKNITVASWKNYDVQKLLKESAVMITDYSSVAMDFAYMKKPVIYYTFDIKQFRKGQYEKGYYDYEKNALGYNAKEEKEVIKQLKEIYKKNFNVDNIMKEKMIKFFELYDNRNCERVYRAIKEIK